MAQMLTAETLAAENHYFAGTGGVSQENRCFGFSPGFLDRETGAIYCSCWDDGRPAPFHALNGLPDHLVLARNPRGQIIAIKPSVVAGFIHQGLFYTREQAACRLK
ncbi:MAG: hypothetical protein WAT67_01320 [Candidatus Contendobacter sp.]